MRTPAAKRGPAMKLGARAIPNLRSAAARHASALERSSLPFTSIVRQSAPSGFRKRHLSGSRKLASITQSCPGSAKADSSAARMGFSGPNQETNFIKSLVTMTNIAVLNGAWVLVGDGRRALFLENHGDPDLLNLSVIEARVEDNPATHDQGTGAPGRAFASRDGPRDSVETTDWHETRERAFRRSHRDDHQQGGRIG